MQPIERRSTMPTPMMPAAREATRTPQAKRQSTSGDEVRAAEARVTLRNSLRKQREALKAKHGTAFDNQNS
jgi:hypothetical protein